MTPFSSCVMFCPRSNGVFFVHVMICIHGNREKEREREREKRQTDRQKEKAGK